MCVEGDEMCIRDRVMTERQLKPEQLAYINSYLNSRLRDIPLSKIGVSLLKEIAAELKEYSNVLEATLEAVVQMCIRDSMLGHNLPRYCRKGMAYR